MGELVRRTERQVTLDEAKRLSGSRLVPKDLHKDPASVEYVMHLGAGLGIDPASAFQHIFVFRDRKTDTLKAGLSAHLMAALAFGAGHHLHVSGDALSATAVLIRRTSDEEIARFRTMREDERAAKAALLEDTRSLYELQRQQILDRIADLKELAALDEKPAEEEVAALRAQLAALHEQYDFDQLRQAIGETRFDLEKILRFESVWTFKRASAIEGLTGKQVWKDFRPEMLKSRAKSSVVRDGAIDVILGVRNFMANLGVVFSGERDDEIAMANAVYTPEELGADVNGDGVPIEGEIVDVTDEKANPRLARLMERARTIVGKRDPDALLAWAKKLAEHPEGSVDKKTSLLEAVMEAAREEGKAEVVVPDDAKEAPLFDHLKTIADNLR